MEPVDVVGLARDLDALSAELDEERYRHVAGLEPEPALGAIFRRHHRAAHKDTAKALADLGEKALSARVAALRAERAQADDEEAWRAADAAAVASGPDGDVALGDALLAVARERDRERRLAFGRGVAAALDGAAREAAAERRARARSEVGLVPAWEKVVEADALLAASDDGYRDVLAWLARHEAHLALPPAGDLTRADLLYVVALHGWDALFPPGMLSLGLERALEPLRIDLGRVRVDDAARRAQWPGAHAVGSRVSLRRQGGAADWLGAFEAAGAAIAASSAPFHRREDAAAPTFGALLAGLLLDPGFLAARLGVERKRAADLVRALAVRQLFRLRARAAALRVAAEVERGASGAAWYEAHREALSAAAFASWPAGLAARDADASAHAAALTGAARAEALRRLLVERNDVDWWKNPRSVDVVGGALAAGGAWQGDEPKLALAAEALVGKLQ